MRSARSLLEASVLVLAALSAPSGAAGGEPAPGRAVRLIDETSWIGADGRTRLLYRPRFLAAPDLLADAKLFGVSGVDLGLDGGRGRLLLTGAEATLPAAREALDWLDAPPGEVLVEVSIVETIKRRHGESGGHALFDRDGVPGAPDTFFRGLRYDFEPDSWLRSQLVGERPFSGSSVAFGQDGPSGLLSGAVDMVLRGMATEGEADFLACPSIACTEGIPATMSSTLQLPSSVFTRAGPLVRLETVGEKTGVSLEVTVLRVGADRVVLRLHPWVREIAEASSPAGPVGAPVLEIRELDTVLTLSDGLSVVVGGLASLRGVADRRGFPWLARLPGVGGALEARLDESYESELTFLVRPRILRPGRGTPSLLPPGEAERLLRRPSRARVVGSTRVR